MLPSGSCQTSNEKSKNMCSGPCIQIGQVSFKFASPFSSHFDNLSSLKKHIYMHTNRLFDKKKKKKKISKSFQAYTVSKMEDVKCTEPKCTWALWGHAMCWRLSACGGSRPGPAAWSVALWINTRGCKRSFTMYK